MKQIKYSIMMLLALLLSAFGTAVQAQGLSGSGTAADPYVIASAADWNTFASNVTGGTSYNGQFVKLTADISVSTMAGTDANRFRGTFDGAGHTLTVNINTGETRAAPFSWVNGAIIKRLHVAGTITTSNQFAGVVGHVDGGCMIIGCHSSITINSTCSGDGTHGGFIGLNNGGTVYIINSLFDGTFTSSSTTNWGGFVGWGHSFVYTILINCVFDPANTSWGFSTGGSNTFSRNPGQATCTNCYYIQPLGDNSNANTTNASSYTNSQLQAALGGAWEIAGGKVVPVTTLQPLTGNGSADSPYLIASTTDWNNMAFNVTTLGESYDGMFLKMTNNVTVSEMVGTHELRFSGNFNGDGHTLTFNKGTSGSRFGDPYCAPFRYVKGATLRFLRIAGTIYTQNSHAAVVGNAHGNTTFLNCRSSIEINSAVNGDGTHGGFVGVIDDGHVYCINSLFDGKLIGTTTTHCGGFIGWTDADFGSSSSAFTHCLFGPTQVTVDATNSATFSRGRNDNTSNITCTGSYYRQALGTAQGTAVGSMSNEELLTALGSGWEIADNQVVPKMSLWTGEGSASSPYLIATTADWDLLGSMVNSGASFSGMHFRLTADISVTTMIGTSAHLFGGIFDGDGHTLTVAYNTTSDNAAPFLYVDNATIRNLHVAGSILTTMRYAGGFVSTSENTLTLENCRSSVSITTSYGGDATCGGLVGVIHGNSTITGCLFDGVLSSSSNSYNCGGLVGWVGGGLTVTFSDCVFAPSGLAVGILQKTLSRGSGTLTFNNCHYTRAEGDVQGQRAWPVTGTEGVTVALAGSATSTYSVSGLTFYGTGGAFVCDSVVYGETGANLSLNITPAGNYHATTGTLSGSGNPYTFTVASAPAVIGILHYTLNDIPAGWTVTVDGSPVTVTDGSVTIAQGAAVTVTPSASISDRVKNVAVDPWLLEGTLGGQFSVSGSQQVYFSKGNLQYIGSAATPYWKFADSQWDFLGVSTGQASTASNVDRDLFSWGTSGHSNGATAYQPWATGTTNSDYYAYGDQNASLSDQTGMADWGKNAIVGGCHRASSGWRTLSRSEWVYLFNTRSASTVNGVANARYAKANVAGANGIILFPNSYSHPSGVPQPVNINANSTFVGNTYTAEQFALMEANGAVFLIAAGSRNGTAMSYVGNFSLYWTSTPYNANAAYFMLVSGASIDPQGNYNRSNGCSVRLVKNTSGVSIPNSPHPDSQSSTRNADGSWSFTMPAGDKSLSVEYGVARIGGTVYSTLGEAVAAAASGNTIELLADIVIPDGTNIVVGTNCTIDYNGYIISGDGFLQWSTNITLTDSDPRGRGGMKSMYGRAAGTARATLLGGRYDDPPSLILAGDYADWYTIPTGYAIIDINADGSPDADGFRSRVYPTATLTLATTGSGTLQLAGDGSSLPLGVAATATPNVYTVAIGVPVPVVATPAAGNYLTGFSGQSRPSIAPVAMTLAIGGDTTLTAGFASLVTLTTAVNDPNRGQITLNYEAGVASTYYDVANLTTIDENNDGRTWTDNTANGTMTYAANPNDAAADWIVLPPVMVAAGTTYTLSFAAQTGTVAEHIEARASTASTYASLRQGFVVMDSTDLLSPTGFTTYSGTFTPFTDGEYFFAIRTFSDSWADHITIANIHVESAAGDILDRVAAQTGGTYSVVPGTTVPLTAHSYTSYHFTHWNNDVADSSADKTVTVNSNMTVTANFGGNPVMTLRSNPVDGSEGHVIVDFKPYYVAQPLYGGSHPQESIPVNANAINDGMYTRSQFIIPGSELGYVLGTGLSDLSFELNSETHYTTSAPVDIYLKEVNFDRLDAFVPKDSCTVVYHGTLTYTNYGMSVAFDTLFPYYGRNLLVGFDCAMPASGATAVNINYRSAPRYNISLTGSSATSLDAITATRVNWVPLVTVSGYKTMPNGVFAITDSTYHVVPGTRVPIKGMAATNHHFEHWENDSTEMGRVVVVDSDTTYTGYFEINPLVTLVADPAQGGTMTLLSKSTTLWGDGVEEFTPEPLIRDPWASNGSYYVPTEPYNADDITLTSFNARIHKYYKVWDADYHGEKWAGFRFVSGSGNFTRIELRLKADGYKNFGSPDYEPYGNMGWERCGDTLVWSGDTDVVEFHACYLSIVQIAFFRDVAASDASSGIAGSYYVYPDLDYHIVATPDSGYYVKNFDNDPDTNSLVAVDKVYTITSDTTITGHFAPYPVLTLASNDTNKGTVEVYIDHTPIDRSETLTTCANSITGELFTVTAQSSDSYGVDIGRGHQVDISAPGGDIITYIEFQVGYNAGEIGTMLSSAGTVDATGGVISNINSSSLTLSSTCGNWLQINQMTIHYLFTPTSIAGVTDHGDGTYTVVPGTTVPVKAQAGTLCHVAGWQNENNTDYPATAITYSGYAVTTPTNLFPATSMLTLNVTGDTTARAMFSTNSYDVAASVATTTDVRGTVGASYTNVGGTSQTAGPAASVNITALGASTTTLTATPATGYHFVNWTSATGAVLGTSATLTTTSALTAVANFDTNSYTVTYTVQNDTRATIGTGLPMGTVTLGGRHMHFLNDTLAVTPDYGYLFDGWYVGGTLVSSSNPYTFSPTGNISFEARFVPDTFAVSTTPNIATAGTLNGAGNYPYRTIVTLTETPATGYHFVNWTAGTTTLGTASTLTLQLMGDTAITANFDTNSYTVTYTVQNDTRATIGTGLPMGTVTLGGRHMHFLNDTLAVTPDYGYLFDGWYVGGTLVSTSNPYIFSPTGDISFEARFVPDTFAVSTTPNIATAGTLTGAGNYPYRTFVTLTETPATGYHFVNWTAGTTTLGTASTLTLQLMGDTTVTANFDTNSYTVTYTVQNDTRATIGTGLPMGTVTLGGRHMHFLNDILTATPAYGYLFDGWYVGGTLVSTSNPYIFSPTGDISFEARFVPDTFAVTTTPNIATAGTFTGAGNYPYRTIVTLTEVPATGYHFVNWTAGTTTLGTSGTLTLQLLGDTTVTANFDTNSYTVTYTVQNDTRATIGTGLPMGTVTLGGRHVHFLDDTLAVTPDYGYLFDGWYVGGTLVSTSNPYTFSPTGNISFEARFVPDTFAVTTTPNIATAGTLTGAGNYPYRTIVTLTEVPATGYHFVNWTAGTTTLGTDSTLTLQVLSDTAITANFDTNVYNVVAGVNIDGLGTVTGAGQVKHFLSTTLVATANLGYHFVDWVDTLGTELGTADSIVVFPTGDTTLVAVFDTNIYATLWIGSDTTVYNAQPYTGLTATYTDFWGNSHTPQLTFVCGSETITTPNYPMEAGTWTVTATGEIGDSLTSPTATLVILPAPVHVSGAQAEIARFYTGDNVSLVTDAGTLVGIQGNDPLTHTTTATFSSSAVGRGYTVTLHYALNPHAIVRNYILYPTEEVFSTNGSILEIITPGVNPSTTPDTLDGVCDGFMVDPFGYCSGGGTIDFYLEKGSVDQYKLVFAHPAIADIDWIDVAVDANGRGTIHFTLPGDLTTGDYSVTVTLRDHNFPTLVSDPVTVSFHIDLSETYVRPLFADVIAIIDTCQCFTDMQWYRRPAGETEWELIPGANGYYYSQAGGLVGWEFRAGCVFNGIPTFTCPQTDMETLIGEENVTVYPNPTTEKVTVTVTGSQAAQHTLRVMSSVGVVMESRTFEGHTTAIDMQGYQTGTYMVTVDGIVVRVIKK